MIKYENFELTKFNSYLINSFCSKAWFPQNEEDILSIYKQQKSIPKIIIGSGNNIILSKENYEEEFVIFNGCFDKIEVKENQLVAEAGATLFQLSELALEKHLSGFEIFYDIPSSVGGAVVMNAGASGEEIKNLLVKVRYLDLNDLKIKELDKDEIGFEYRNSFFQKNTNNIVLKAWFQLKPGNYEDIKSKMEQTKIARWVKQPREFPNCGSVFKRPPGYFVGTLIEELGLKGYSIGGAQISEKHAGFIVNFNNAKGSEIIELIQYIKQEVFNKFKIELEVEQRII